MSSQMIYYDAKNISDILMHLFMTINNEVREDGIKKEFPDLLYVFDGYMDPFMTEEEREKIKEYDEQIERFKRQNIRPMVEKFRFLMRLANEKKFLRKGTEYKSEVETWATMPP